MERSSKHGPRLDDAMSAETETLTRASREARAEEWREMEPPGEDQPLPDRLLSGDPQGPPGRAGIGHDAAELRAELAAHLRKDVWPADRATLEAIAREESAPDRVLGLLARLPADRDYVNLQDVWRTLGGEVEEGRG